MNFHEKHGIRKRGEFCKSYRLFGIFRFVLALMVVVSHSTQLGGSEIDSVLHPWGMGNVAVMVFFCLSGYIIAEALEVFYYQKTRKFLLNRVLRIIPPYLAALLFSILAHLWLSSLGTMKFFDYDSTPDGIFSGTNLLSNFLTIIVLYGLGHVGLQSDYLFVRYIWAVRVEMHFYVAYALVYSMFIARKFFGMVCGYVMPIAFALFSILFVTSLWTNASFLNYFSFAPYFMLGVSLYFAIEKGAKGARLATILSLAMAVSHFVIYVGKGVHSLVWGPVFLLLALFVVVVLLARSQKGESLKQIDQWLGDLSYPVYLNHYAVTIVMLSLFPQGTPSVFLLCIVLSVVVSWAISLVTEPLTKGLRNKIRGTALR